ncbi:F0F1 ATP synthase subunit delta [Inmirania thermothiophila]|uniref:ATP synthase subunit delta n=1 Tax=Inmirania thermothiophila TaxID=1750597 RepID=A0A3N1Y9P0_9GAMM|nr:F0F1 ATP synthase subunit delta [Inmirania thermothiophila]ROR34332.1 F-type H+-transporting ATPase subunit delta [Inmirania thermothiophila]
MAELITVARPYARAVFELARERGELELWSRRLQDLAAVAATPEVAALVRSPRVGKERVYALLVELVGEQLGAEGRNLLRLLVENRRLALLPAIAEAYEALRMEAEGRVRAEVVSARPLEEAQAERIRAALERRLGRKVELGHRVDESLIGGAVIRAGDLVIDGSVRGRLQRLAAELAG